MFYVLYNNSCNISSGTAVKKDDGSSKASTEVRKPTGVKIQAEVEPSKPKVA
jgi:hypothetical protein